MKVKKLLAVFMVLTLLISAVSLTSLNAFAETSEDFEYRILENGTAEITGYNGTAEDLVIPSKIDGYEVTSIGEQAFLVNKLITSITFPDTITNIGLMAFWGCDKITRVELSKNLTNISSGAFGECMSLEKIELPDSVKIIEDESFRSCTHLAEIVIPSSVTKIGQRAFGGCQALKKFTVDPTNINYCDINGVLFNKEQTELLAYPNLSSKSYTIPDTVTAISPFAFELCDNLTTVKISDGVKAIGEYAFIGCSSLESINIPRSILRINDYTFYACTSLFSIEIPENVKEIGNDAFELCSNIKHVNIANGVHKIESYAFSGCDNLKEITIPESVTSIEHEAIGFCFRGGGKNADLSNDSEIYDDTGKMIDFTIYGNIGTAAETYANENGFEFIDLNEVTDKDTGISISSKENDAIPNGAELKAEKLASEKDKVVFDISLVKDGVKVQPNGEVTVKIPVPEGMDSSVLKVYREEANGNFTDMNAYFANGYMVFTTNHFSKYVLTTDEIPEIKKGDVNGDGIIDAADAVLVQRYDAGLVVLNDSQLKTADVNSDGITDAADAVIIMRYDAGLISQL